MARYKPTEFISDGGISVVGLPILIAALAVAAVLLGAITSFVGQYFYLILMFPVFIGFGLGVAGAAVNRVGKLRNMWVAFLLGLITGAGALLAMHVFDWQRDASDHYPTFLGYMDATATKGVEIGSRSSSGLNLGYIGTVIYWTVEVIVVAVITAILIVASAASPFCSRCNVWKQERKLGRLTGEGTGVAALLKEGDVSELNAFEPALNEGNLLINVHVCPNCGDDEPIEVTVATAATGSDDSPTDVAQLTFPGRALADFEEVFQLVSGPRKKRRRREEE